MANIKKYEEDLLSSKLLGEMHLPISEKEDITSIYPYNKEKLLFHIGVWKQMEASSDPNNKKRFNYDSLIYPYHGLHSSILITKTPHLKVKDGYKIRFCDDLFIEMIDKYSLKFDTEIIHTGNKLSLKFQSRKDYEWPKYKKEIGNNERLTKFSNEIPSIDISIKLPWCYSLENTSYFPLFICGNTNKLVHSIEFKLEISELLIIQDNDGNLVQFNEDIFEIYSPTIDVPRLKGHYSLCTEGDYKSNIENLNGERRYFVDNMYYVEDKEKRELGEGRPETCPLNIDVKQRYLTNNIFWGAVNVTKSKLNKSLSLFSNYPYESPIKHTSINNSHSEILKEEDSYDTEVAFVNSPHNITDQRGLNYWENSVVKMKDNRKFLPRIDMKGGKIDIALQEDFTNKDKYLPFCIIMYSRKFIFSNFPKNDGERKQMGAKITLVED